jgi:hypothetical protein
MNKKLPVFLAASLLISAPVLACDYPERPAIPDGTTASKDDMVAASADVKKYLADVDTYLTCIEGVEKEAIEAMENPTEEEIANRTENLDKRFAAANEEKALVGEMFNQQVRAYNAKAKSDDE